MIHKQVQFLCTYLFDLFSFLLYVFLVILLHSFEEFTIICSLRILFRMYDFLIRDKYQSH